VLSFISVYLYSNLLSKPLTDKINPRVALTTTDELEDDVWKFVTDIQHSAWEATSLITTKVKGNTYPLEIRDKIAKKRKSGKDGK
jgi:hypothetical protein